MYRWQAPVGRLQWPGARFHRKMRPKRRAAVAAVLPKVLSVRATSSQERVASVVTVPSTGAIIEITPFSWPTKICARLAKHVGAGWQRVSDVRRLGLAWTYLGLHRVAGHAHNVGFGQVRVEDDHAAIRVEHR